MNTPTPPTDRPGDWYQLPQLAIFMGESEEDAADILAWLEQNGWLSKTPGTPTADGRPTYQYRLTIPEAQS
jgi:hypothetical protein